MTVYLDANATTPVDPRVAELVLRYMLEEFGNAGSRTHDYGLRAKKAVQAAREQVASVAKAESDEIIFTSGATESNNISILGLADFGRSRGLRHIVTSQIEHKAVLEPIERLEREGFEVTRLPPGPGGFVEASALQQALRPDTLLVSLMHVNNETGVIQPIDEFAEVLSQRSTYFHVDAAQSYGKLSDGLTNKRIDFMSVSGHKVYAPKGVGALITRRRGYERPPLKPLMVGGGQERGLRPGTLPVPLIAGLGMAAQLAQQDREERRHCCEKFGAQLRTAITRLGGQINGDPQHVIHSTLNVRFPGIDAEALMVALKGIAAVSNGSACTSASYTPSHVLLAMGLSEEEAQEAVRLSWSHATPVMDWAAFERAVRGLG